MERREVDGESRRRWREANREKLLADKRAWYRANRERLAAHYRETYLKNRRCQGIRESESGRSRGGHATAQGA